jgi:hypothetical protein
MAAEGTANEPIRWKPALAAYRPRSLAAPKPKRPLPGQRYLPGMNPRRRVCPNCGGRRFDADGDCLRCWEPGVGSAKSRSKS